MRVVEIDSEPGGLWEKKRTKNIQRFEENSSNEMRRDVESDSMHLVQGNAGLYSQKTNGRLNLVEVPRDFFINIR